MRGFQSAQVFVVFTNKRRSCRHDDLKIDAACLGARAAGPYSTVAVVELPRRRSPPFGRGWNLPLQCANEYHRWATRGLTGDHHRHGKQRALAHDTDIFLTPRVSPYSPHCTAVPSRVKTLRIPVPDNQRFSEFLSFGMIKVPALRTHRVIHSRNVFRTIKLFPNPRCFLGSAGFQPLSCGT